MGRFAECGEQRMRRGLAGYEKNAQQKEDYTPDGESHIWCTEQVYITETA